MSDAVTGAMNPYYDEGGITIYHGDCREVLPGLSGVDAAITDPPYGTNYYATDKAVFTVDLFSSLPRPCAVFGWPERLVALCVAAAVVPDEWVTWWPTNGALRGLNFNGLRRETEHIAVFGPHTFQKLRQPLGSSSRRVRSTNYLHADGTAGRGLDTHGEPTTRGVGDVWEDPSPGLGFQSHQRHHPNEKPVRVMHRLVEALTSAGEVVLDPFAGSGTTLRAAKDLNRRAIGIEIEERYCEIAAKRLAQGVFDFATGAAGDG